MRRLRRPGGRPRPAPGRGARVALAGLVAGLLAGFAAPAPAGADPLWWLTIGGEAAIESGDLDSTLGTEGGGLVGAGWQAVRLGALLVGVEAEGSAGQVRASFGLVTETVTVWRGRGGLRLTWLPEDEPPVLTPYLRAGAVYRADRSDLVKDEGLGWYAGAGLDWTFAENWSVGPFVTYEEAGLSITTRTWLLGLGLTYSR